MPPGVPSFPHARDGTSSSSSLYSNGGNKNSEGELRRKRRRGGGEMSHFEGENKESEEEEDVSSPLRGFVSNDTDFVYEEELQRNPYQVKVWCAYLLSKKDAPPSTR